MNWIGKESAATTTATGLPGGRNEMPRTGKDRHCRINLHQALCPVLRRSQIARSCRQVPKIQKPRQQSAETRPLSQSAEVKNSSSARPVSCATTHPTRPSCERQAHRVKYTGPEISGQAVSNSLESSEHNNPIVINNLILRTLESRKKARTQSAAGSSGEKQHHNQESDREQNPSGPSFRR
jgi:hypothetical protein